MSRDPVSSATDLASCVLPVPAGPSTSTGLASRSARYTDAADGVVGQVADVGQAAPHRVERGEAGRPDVGQPQGAGTRGVSGGARPPRALTDAPARLPARPISRWSTPALPSVPGRAASGSRCRPRRPSPSSSPSMNRVEAFTSTAAASTSATNRSAARTSAVTMASEWPEPKRAMCADGAVEVVDHAHGHRRPQELGGEVGSRRPPPRRARSARTRSSPRSSTPAAARARRHAGQELARPRRRAPGSSRPRCTRRSGGSWR